MAHILDLGDQTDIKWIFNVSTSVGLNAYNRVDDVMLIQHVLNTLLAAMDIRDSNGNRFTSYLKRDGICGPRTRAAILGYQRVSQKNGKVLNRRRPGEPRHRDGLDQQQRAVHHRSPQPRPPQRARQDDGREGLSRAIAPRLPGRAGRLTGGGRTRSRHRPRPGRGPAPRAGATVGASHAFAN